MSLIKNCLYRLKNGKRTINNPIFLKEFNSVNNQLNDLIKLSNQVKSTKRELIDSDIKLLKQQLEGDQNVYYELKNSSLPMLCIYDIRLQYDNYIAQFDYIVITKKCIFVLETKTLNGDIEITQDGDFMRVVKNRYGEVFKREGMYNPISHNSVHVKILKDILTKEKLIKNINIESLVVMANSKYIINKLECPKAIGEKIYELDQIEGIIENVLNDESNKTELLEKYLYTIGYYIIENSKPKSFDYSKKYALTDKDFIGEDLEERNENEMKSNCIAQVSEI